MKLETPQRGSVIRYAYLWADEHRRGRDEATKERPSLVLALTVRQDNGATQVLVLAITHTKPTNPSDAVPLPPNVKRQLGLDDDASWIVTTEANAFLWPGPDLRPVPDRDPATVFYGQIPDKLLQDVALSYLANRKRQLGEMVSRST